MTQYYDFPFDKQDCQSAYHITNALAHLTASESLAVYLLATINGPFTPLSDSLQASFRSLQAKSIVETLGASAAYQFTAFGYALVHRAMMVGLIESFGGGRS